MPYDANKNELEILKFWQDNKIFERSVSERSEKKPYVFYDGPPFATGLPHYGHILGSVIKDLIPRYQTMKGYRVRRRWGWDCHGLPIENLVEKELEVSGKKQIEEKLGVEKFNDTCRSKVLLYTKEWKKMVDRIGRWVEFDNSYKTMDSTYMESVWWALKTIWNKGLIYEGRKVLMYCPHCETPVSKAEVAMDDSYKDITEEAVVVKFSIFNFQFSIPNDKPVYILAWTTTPWTLPGNVALAVGEDIDYVLVEVDGENLILAKDRVETVMRDKRYEIRDRMKGSDLVGLEYESLFPYYGARGLVLSCTQHHEHRDKHDVKYNSTSNKYNDANYFDPIYFSYCEDLDLGWRARNLGFEAKYAKDAIVYHKGSAIHGKLSDFAVYHTYRNLLWTQFKNFPAPLLLWQSPWLGVGWFFIISLYFFKGRPSIIFRALWDGARGLRFALNRRGQIQRNRKATQKQILSWFASGLFPKSFVK